MLDLWGIKKYLWGPTSAPHTPSPLKNNERLPPLAQYVTLMRMNNK